MLLASRFIEAVDKLNVNRYTKAWIVKCVENIGEYESLSLEKPSIGQGWEWRLAMIVVVDAYRAPQDRGVYLCSSAKEGRTRTNGCFQGNRFWSICIPPIGQ